MSREDAAQSRFLKEKDEQCGRRDAEENDGINQVIDEVSAWKIRLTGGCGGHDGGGEALGNQTSDDRALDGRRR